MLGAEDLADARVAADLRAAAPSCAGWRAPTRRCSGPPHELLEALAAVEVREPSAIAGAGARAASPRPPRARRACCSPTRSTIRARRFRAVFVCGLQDGEFPRRPEPEPFLSDDDRRGLAPASGLRLPLHEDVLDRERSLFYAAVSRPEDVLFLSWRSSDEEGDPLAPSAFLDDVRALFTDELWEERGTRLLADVTWAPRDAPTPHELRRAYAAAAERARAGAARRARPTARCSALLAARDTEPARGLEAFAALRRALAGRAAPAPGPHRARPRADAARLARPRRARADARRCCASAPARRGSRRSGSTPRSGAAADALAERARGGPHGALARAAARPGGRPRALPAHGGRVRRRLRADRARVVVRPPSTTRTGRSRSATAAGSVTGRVDRVDVGPGGAAIVRDYKGRTVVGGAKWADELQLQVALYLLAVRELLGLEPVAGLYQPLVGRKLGARGLVRDDVPGPLHAHRRRRRATPSTPRSRPRARWRRAPPPTCTPGGCAPCPERCSSRGCRYPGDLPRAASRTREAPA